MIHALIYVGIAISYLLAGVGMFALYIRCLKFPHNVGVFILCLLVWPAFLSVTLLCWLDYLGGMVYRKVTGIVDFDKDLDHRRLLKRILETRDVLQVLIGIDRDLDRVIAKRLGR